jgi:hypothetical protein
MRRIRLKSYRPMIMMVVAGLALGTGPRLVEAEGLREITGSIRGKILGEEGQPMAGVSVQILKPGDGEPRRSTESDAEGLYRFSNVDPGLYLLEVAHSGFQADSKVVIVAYEGRTTMHLILRREAPRLPSGR